MPGPANSLNITQPGVVVFDGVSAFSGRTITAGTGISISNGSGISGNPTISLSGGGTSVQHLTGDTGGQLNPDGSNNFNTVGTGSITIAGSGSTLTSQLTGLTNHALLVGAGTATITKVGPSSTSGQILQSAGASADPAFSTSTYPTTNAVSTLLYASSANVMAALATANNGVLVTDGSGVPSIGSTLPTAVQGNITSTGNLGNQLNTTKTAFLAYLATAANDVTGDGTVFTLGTTTALTEVFDINGDFNTNGTFTAPVTGKYNFAGSFRPTQLSALFTTNTTNVITSNRTYRVCDTGNISDAGTNASYSFSVVCADMDAADTMTATYTCSGSTKTIDMTGSATLINFISGYLAF